MFSVKTNIPTIKDRLLRIKTLIDGGWQSEARTLCKKTLAEVKRRTPKSKGKGSTRIKGNRFRNKRGRFATTSRNTHIRNGWTMREIGRGGKSRIPFFAVVYNKFTHDVKGQHKKSALLEGKNYTLLEVLEYGSRPHPIEPRKKIYLKFQT